jgi:hypothetical protein
VQADQDILAWLTSAVTAEDAEIRRIVTVLRSRIYAPSSAPER